MGRSSGRGQQWSRQCCTQHLSSCGSHRGHCHKHPNRGAYGQGGGQAGRASGSLKHTVLHSAHEQLQWSRTRVFRQVVQETDLDAISTAEASHSELPQAVLLASNMGRGQEEL